MLELLSYPPSLSCHINFTTMTLAFESSNPSPYMADISIEQHTPWWTSMSCIWWWLSHVHIPPWLRVWTWVRPSAHTKVNLQSIHLYGRYIYRTRYLLIVLNEMHSAVVIPCQYPPSLKSLTLGQTPRPLYLVYQSIPLYSRYIYRVRYPQIECNVLHNAMVIPCLYPPSIQSSNPG